MTNRRKLEPREAVRYREKNREVREIGKREE